MSRPLSVLLVASDGLTRQITANGLNMYGYEPLLARDGAEAMGILESERRVDVLVVDADIGGDLSGLAVAKAARLLHPRIDVIYASRAPHRIPDEAKVKGAPSIRTPYQPQQIVGMIGELRYRMPADGIDRRVA
ncbi:response regulator [Enterovirga aerilata]|uniref:Response regulator n=1 Tax=Enterovirga aerilata TaxID=2730920 RepID=A0A849I846_9HYPH|nr:response regulator [Enterovirga sp. DB1703]NNM72177.1 response regulator [Enterovirga sp. DB1703]